MPTEQKEKAKNHLQRAFIKIQAAAAILEICDTSPCFLWRTLVLKEIADKVKLVGLSVSRTATI